MDSQHAVHLMLYGLKPAMAQAHKQYVESKVWKCDRSPCNAHYWIIDDNGNGVCIHCNTTKKHPVHINGIN